MSHLPTKLTRDEAIVLVERIMSLGYIDDAELNSLLDQLERGLVCPDIADLIFSVPELTAAEVVDQATAHEPIEMRSGPWAEPSTT
ncbi:e9imm peptide [Micromonospora sp. NBC_01740]|uniref:e9imm peptide n=1 Tax=Micromonospora sp. NBC_01740 TaxID=2975986 RepID=UPI002E13C916|nr:e9imm peptide [Micromonospora sp. NBC_01740]